MKQFTFDIQNKLVTKESITLRLDLSGLEGLDLKDFFPVNTLQWYDLVLRGRVDDIKITDKIIISFDINEVNLEEEYLDKLDKLLCKQQYHQDIVANNQKDRILSKIKYLIDIAPVAE